MSKKKKEKEKEKPFIIPYASEMSESVRDENESVQQKQTLKQVLTRQKITYQVSLYVAIALYSLIVISLGLYAYNLDSDNKKLKAQIEVDTKIKNDQNKKILENQNEIKNLKNEVSTLKDNLSKKTESEKNLMIQVKNLTNENNNLKKNLKEAKEKINKLTAENISLNEKLGVILQDEIIKEKNKKQIYNDVFNYNILCKNCPNSVPILTITEKDSKILINANCVECDYVEEFEINNYLEKIKETSKSSIHYCEKTDGSHKTKKATYYYYGNYYCDECAKDLQKLVQSNELKKINEGVIYSEEKYKYFCPVCGKHYTDLLSHEEHNPSHTVINIEEYTKNILFNDKEKIFKNIDDYLESEMTKFKNKLYDSLPHILVKVNYMVDAYKNRIKGLLYLGNIIEYNYQKNHDYPNYAIMHNYREFIDTITQKLDLKDFSKFKDSEIDVYNVGPIFKSLEDILKH